MIMILSSVRHICAAITRTRPAVSAPSTSSAAVVRVVRVVRGQFRSATVVPPSRLRRELVLDGRYMRAGRGEFIQQVRGIGIGNEQMAMRRAQEAFAHGDIEGREKRILELRNIVGTRQVRTRAGFPVRRMLDGAAEGRHVAIADSGEHRLTDVFRQRITQPWRVQVVPRATVGVDDRSLHP